MVKTMPKFIFEKPRILVYVVVRNLALLAQDEDEELKCATLADLEEVCWNPINLKWRFDKTLHWVAVVTLRVNSDKCCKYFC